MYATLRRSLIVTLVALFSAVGAPCTIRAGVNSDSVLAQPRNTRASAISLQWNTGVWKGWVQQQRPTIEYTVLITLTEGQPGTVVGTSAYPELGCAGELTLLHLTDGSMELSEKITLGVECIDNGHITLTRVGGNALVYWWRSNLYPAIAISTMSQIGSDDSGDVPIEYVGVWRGTAQGFGEYSILIALTGGNPETIVGVVAYPSHRCAGEFTLQSASTDSVVLLEGLTFGFSTCIDGGVVTLSMREDGNLDYEWRMSGRVNIGTLSRISSPEVVWLDLPFDYTDSAFIDGSRDYAQGGKVKSYFDHQYPTDNSFANTGQRNVISFHGYDSSQTNPSSPYKVAYDEHDGIDFYVGQGTPVLAAGPGIVIFRGRVSSTCQDGQTRTANVIKVEHTNGYVTEYWHLSSFASGMVTHAQVSRDPSHPIGYVGNTGCSTGPHLHFMVRNASGIQVDPYGWKPHPDAKWYHETDPWQQYKADNGGLDATSYYLWYRPLEAAALITSSTATNITATSRQVVVAVPAGAYDDHLRIELAETLQSARISGYRSLRTFSLFGFTPNNDPVTTLEAEVSLDIYTSITRGMHNVMTPTLLVWNTQLSTWQELPTTWDPIVGHASATSSQIGTFALAIPLHETFLPVMFR